MKKILVGILMLCMMAVSAVAFSGSGSGTEGSPYLITNCTNLQEMNDDLTAYYTLANNIDCSDTINWNGGEGFIPISGGTIDCENLNLFNSTLDGQGYVISNLYQNSSTYCAGLFCVLMGGTIKNVGLENVDMTTATGAAGALVGNMGDVCSLGLISTISNCYATGSVTTSGTGGTGGLVGYSTEANAIINGSFSRVAVTAPSWVGGLVGQFESDTIQNSYATGLVTGSDYLGGLLGLNTGTVISSYWDIETTGQNTSAGGTGMTTAEMKTQSTYTDWDFVSTWQICSEINGGYPSLQVFGLCGGTCTPDWACSEYEAECGIDDTQDCIAVEDNNECGEQYTGNYSEFTPLECDYCTPDWACSSFSTCVTNVRQCLAVTDSLACHAQTNLSSDLFSGNLSTYNEVCNGFLDNAETGNATGNGWYLHPYPFVGASSITYGGAVSSQFPLNMLIYPFEGNKSLLLKARGTAYATIALRNAHTPETEFSVSGYIFDTMDAYQQSAIGISDMMGFNGIAMGMLPCEKNNDGTYQSIVFSGENYPNNRYCICTDMNYTGAGGSPIFAECNLIELYAGGVDYGTSASLRTLGWHRMTMLFNNSINATSPIEFYVDDVKLVVANQVKAALGAKIAGLFNTSITVALFERQGVSSTIQVPFDKIEFYDLTGELSAGCVPDFVCLKDSFCHKNKWVNSEKAVKVCVMLVDLNGCRWSINQSIERDFNISRSDKKLTWQYNDMFDGIYTNCTEDNDAPTFTVEGYSTVVKSKGGKNKINYTDYTVIPPKEILSYLSISDSNVIIDEQHAPHMNKPAHITMSELPFTHEPTIWVKRGYLDWQVCGAPYCTNKTWSYNPSMGYGTLSFAVSGFSGYNITGYAQAYTTSDLRDITVDVIGTGLAEGVQWVSMLVLVGIIGLVALQLRKVMPKK